MFISLTVLFPKFLTRQLRYVVFPSRAVTFFEADLSKYGPDRVASSRAFWLYVSLFLPLPPYGMLWQCTSETREIERNYVNVAISMLKERRHSFTATYLKALYVFFVSNVSIVLACWKSRRERKNESSWQNRLVAYYHSRNNVTMFYDRKSKEEVEILKKYLRDE